MNRKLGRSSLFGAATSFFLSALPHPTLAQAPLFNPQTEYIAGSKSGPSGVVVGDFNGDGKPDLAVANFSDWNVWVLLGNGDGTFQAAQTLVVASRPHSYAAGGFYSVGRPRGRAGASLGDK